MIQFSCPECRAKIRAPESKAGHKAPCPGCGQRIQVPISQARSDETVVGELLPKPNNLTEFWELNDPTGPGEVAPQTPASTEVPAGHALVPMSRKYAPPPTPVETPHEGPLAGLDSIGKLRMLLLFIIVRQAARRIFDLFIFGPSTKTGRLCSALIFNGLLYGFLLVSAVLIGAKPFSGAVLATLVLVSLTLASIALINGPSDHGLHRRRAIVEQQLSLLTNLQANIQPTAPTRSADQPIPSLPNTRPTESPQPQNSITGSPAAAPTAPPIPALSGPVTASTAPQPAAGTGLSTTSPAPESALPHRSRSLLMTSAVGLERLLKSVVLLMLLVGLGFAGMYIINHLDTLFPGQPTPTATAEQVYKAEQVYELLLKSVVFVKNKNRNGSGSLIDSKNRIVLTNEHVVKGYDVVTVCFPMFEDGKLVVEASAYDKGLGENSRSPSVVQGKVVWTDSLRDLALVQLDKVPTDAQPLSLGQQARPGQNVYSIGNPGNEARWVYTTGTVRQIYARKWETTGGPHEAKVVETQSPVNPGDSGGPLVNDRNELIAVTQSVDTTSTLRNVFIDVSEVRAFLDAYSQASGTQLSIKYR